MTGIAPETGTSTTRTSIGAGGTERIRRPDPVTTESTL